MSHIIFPINAEPPGKVPPNPSQACPGSQCEGGRQGAAGHLLGVVVVVVVDVDGGCDAADDERDATGDQVEPARGEGGHCSPTRGHGDMGWATASGQAGADPAQLGGPSMRSGFGVGARGCRYRSMGRGAGCAASPSSCRGALQVTSLYRTRAFTAIHSSVDREE